MPNKKKKFNSRFPPARIKKIMQTDEEVGKVAAAVPVLISKALEHFIEALLVKASQQTLEKNAKTLTTSHIKQCIYREKVFDFLKDLVVDIPDLQNAKDHNTPSYSGRNSQPKKHTSGRGKKRKVRPLPSPHSFSEEESLDNNDDDEDEEEYEEEEDDDDEEDSLEGCPTNNAPSGIQADNSPTNNAPSGIQADNSKTNNASGIQADNSTTNNASGIQADNSTTNNASGIPADNIKTNNAQSGIQSDNHTYSKGALTESKLTQDTDQPDPASATPKPMIPPKNILMDLSYPVLMGQYTPRKVSTEQRQEDDEDYDT